MKHHRPRVSRPYPLRAYSSTFGPRKTKPSVLMCGCRIFSRMNRNAHSQYRHVYRRRVMMKWIVRTTRFGRLRGMSARAGGAGTGRAVTFASVPMTSLGFRLLGVQQEIVEERLRKDAPRDHVVETVEA